MSKRKRRHLSAEFKARIAKEAMQGIKTIQQIAQDNDIAPAQVSEVGAKGYCYDNAAVESFWSTLKTECFPETGVFKTKQEAKAAIFEYIESYYNTQRLHSALNYTSPLAAEKAA